MSLNFLFDTMIAGAHVYGHPKVFNRVLQHGWAIGISTVTVGELWVKVVHRGINSTFGRNVATLLIDFSVVPFDLDCARRFGEVRADLLSRGLDIGVPDVMIAATALVHDLTVVTRNVKHFGRIPGLRIQNWLV